MNEWASAVGWRVLTNLLSLNLPSGHARDLRGKNVSFTCNVSQHRIKATRQDVDQSEEYKRRLACYHKKPRNSTTTTFTGELGSRPFPTFPKLRLSATHCKDNRIKSGAQVTGKRGGEKLKTGGLRKQWPLVLINLKKLYQDKLQHTSPSPTLARNCMSSEDNKGLQWSGAEEEWLYSHFLSLGSSAPQWTHGIP
jgi:hypothetical protein